MDSFVKVATVTIGPYPAVDATRGRGGWHWGPYSAGGYAYGPFPDLEATAAAIAAYWGAAPPAPLMILIPWRPGPLGYAARLVDPRAGAITMRGPGPAHRTPF